MITGLVFDIKEFAVHDGPGIRTTVFLKGCPLDCAWCHSPEGKDPAPQVMHTPRGDRISGKVYTPEALAAYLNSQAAILTANEGGVTFSGGEPLMQAAFIHATLDRLAPVHRLLDTSGFAERGVFADLVRRFDLVYYDLKLLDPQAHQRHTGVSNAPILANLQVLSDSGVPFVIRVPLIPTLTDTDENLRAIAEHVRGLPGLMRVDLLPYNQLAGAKYPMLGLAYPLQALEDRPVNRRPDLFTSRGIQVLCH
ncbi:MAG: radical SAM protein [Anaerolineae bacterium]|nr:radical SAM protein [Anaerolineae bacterium]